MTAIVAMALPACPVAAAPLGIYDFVGPDPLGDATIPVATNLTFTPFTRVNVSPLPLPDLFESSYWTETGVQDTGEYVEFTVTPATGYALTLSDVTFDVQRSVDKATPNEKGGPLNGQVQVFQGVGLTLQGTQNFNPEGTVQTVSFDFVDFTTGPGEPVRLRFYGWNAGHKNGMMGLDNITVSGQVFLAPEPSPVALMSMGFVLFLARWVLSPR